ncbi:hypothetical protein JZU56_03565, partial [bacterium]|nr:hypothetical protein [bacterium]
MAVSAPASVVRDVLPVGTATVAPGESGATDKSSEIAQRVTRMILTAQARQAPPTLSAPQMDALTQLQASAASPVELKLHAVTGAVRQIKGDVLHSAKEISLSGSHTDELGRRHLRFDQHYRGLPVWPAQAVVHLDKSGNVDLLNGAYVPTPSDSGAATTPTIAQDKAIALARSAVSGGEAGTLGKVALIFYATDEGVAKLAWKIEAAYNQVMHGSVSGAGVDLGNVSRPLQVYQSGSTYYMFDTSKSMYDPTSAPPDFSKTRGAIVIGDAKHTPVGSPPSGNPSLSNVISGAASSGWLADAVSAAF